MYMCACVCVYVCERERERERDRETERETHVHTTFECHIYQRYPSTDSWVFTQLLIFCN
jgi:hypothetical protein